ncbi:hypothetical protein FB451DRAFT_1397822 [Mycena latifolia]|nr:hypothetical protein FB451DRAFT_1397822 [Mycena latifolia]
MLGVALSLVPPIAVVPGDPVALYAQVLCAVAATFARRLCRHAITRGRRLCRATTVPARRLCRCRTPPAHRLCQRTTAIVRRLCRATTTSARRLGCHVPTAFSLEWPTIAIPLSAQMPASQPPFVNSAPRVSPTPPHPYVTFVGILQPPYVVFVGLRPRPYDALVGMRPRLFLWGGLPSPLLSPPLTCSPPHLPREAAAPPSSLCR